MAQSKNTNHPEFDTVVIGGGLTGLIIANHLESTGRRVALVEAYDALGGSSRAVQTVAGMSDHVLKLIPETSDSEETLTWLETVLDQKIAREVVEAAPVTYEDAKFKPFVGFGGQKVATSVEIDAYAKSRYYRLKSTPKDWVNRLIETFTGTALTNSYVTKLAVEDDFIVEITINGSKRISGREIIFCATPQQLTRLLPESHLPARTRQKLLKGDFWTAVNLEIVHAAPVTESQAIHVLKGANEEPCVGMFEPAVTLEDGRSIQMSKWISFIPKDATDDSEMIASALKGIKRQLKRIYETSLDGVLKERIAVTPISHGDMSGLLAENGQWPRLQNLYVVSGFQDSAKNTLGALKQARRTLASLAGEPPMVMERDTDLDLGLPAPTA
jgi:hypothetical protein